MGDMFDDYRVSRWSIPMLRTHPSIIFPFSILPPVVVSISNGLFSIFRRCISPVEVSCRFECFVAVGGVTYTRQLGTAVTALGGSATLLDVKNTQLTTGSLDNPGPVGGGVVAGGERVLLVICGSLRFNKTFN